ncbi:MAG: hypothetical protein KAT79_03195 [candidate division Zixibacteria bacterium]|nr:hypothetical protein [candidate division Zixibacteria bacterium]
MYSEKYGVNIVSRHNRALFVIVGAVLLGLFGCGQRQSDSTDTPTVDTTAIVAIDSSVADTVSQPEELSADGLAAQEVLREVLTRLKYGDKSGLYENEFEYLTDEMTFDEYLELAPVLNANADTLVSVEVVAFEPSEENSALVTYIVHFKGPSGNESELGDVIRMFKYQGRWIKPTVSVWQNQKEYDDIIRQAEEAADEEG